MAYGWQLTEAADRELILDAVYGEYRAVPARLRARHVWVMDPLMRQMVRRLRGPTGTYLWDPGTLTTHETLLGLPVEVRDGAPGARLEYRP
jgi:HK97 family phage major capsid protein